MEACSLPGRRPFHLPECLNKPGFLECNLNPVVILTDCRKSMKETTGRSPRTSSESEKSEKSVKRPTKSTASPTISNTKRFKSMKNGDGKNWDSSIEYEIENILGYHRDKRKKMWYLVKWKNWSNDYNTYEPITNLTKCNYKLMKFFEVQEPTNEEIVKKSLELEEGLKKRSVYALVSRGFGGNELLKFEHECPDARQLLRVKALDEFEKRIGQEYEYIVRCLIGMYAHQDPGLIVRGQNFKLLLMLIQRRREQLRSLATVEKQINALEETKVAIENNVDLEDFPDVEYIVDLKPRKGVVFPKEPLLSCECSNGCRPKSWCCGETVDSMFAYGLTGRLRTNERIAIYECNSGCPCPPSCPNRVVQRGRKVELCIFKTKSCGWGVKAMEKIPKGAFVCEYVGELIPDSEAVVRDVTYTAENKAGYLFDLDFFEDASLDMYCIDATKQGNLARFINHSCDPNLVVYPVWIDGLQPNLHRLAFFAKKQINKGEEIHFDYRVEELAADEGENEKGNRGLMRIVSDVRCQCKAINCREWVFGCS